MSRTTRAATLALTLALALPAAASAATTITDADGTLPGYIVVRDTAGAANTMDVSVNSTFELVFTDTDTLAAGGDCQQISPNQVECDAVDAQGMDVNLGGNADDFEFDNSTLPPGPLPPFDTRLRGGAGADTIRGSDRADRIEGGTGDDPLLDGLGGDDIIEGGAGSDTIEGGSDGLSLPGPPPEPGAVRGDTVTYEDSPEPIQIFLTDTVIGGNANNGAEGFDTTSEIENVIGSPHNDEMTGTATNAFGLGGANRLEGRAGVDKLFGDPSSITAPATGGNDTLVPGADTDVVNGGPQPAFGFGVPAGDFVDFSDATGAGVTVQLEPAGGFGSADAASGGDSGNDQLADIEHATGSDFADTLVGSTRVEGGRSGDNVLRGRGGDDELHGEPLGTGGENMGGNDTLSGGGGADIMSGGDDGIGLAGPPGDTVDYSSEDRPQNDTESPTPPGGVGESGVTVTIGDDSANDGAGPFDGAGRGDDVRSDVEHVNGTRSDDTIVGDDRTNILSGFEGDDELRGEGGDDTLVGGRDADVLSGGEQSDDGPGDRVSYRFDFDRTSGVAVTLDEAANDGDQNQPGYDGAGDSVFDVESVDGSNFADSLSGDDQDNELFGADGNDVLNGLGGDDRLVGGKDEDVMTGGPGDRDVADYSRFTGDFGRPSNNHFGPDGGEGQPGITVTLDNADGDGETGYDGVAGDNVTADVEDVVGTLSDDELTGSGSDNLLDGGVGDDDLFGELGDDELRGGLHDDDLFGGEGGEDDGGDTVSYLDDEFRTGGVVADIAPAGTTDRDDGTGSEADAVGFDVENLIGTGFADELTGSAEDNRLDGRDDGDKLHGLAGTDLLLGGRGDDTFDGGADEDTASYEDHDEPVEAALGSGADTTGNGSAPEDDTIENDVEHLTGGRAADTLQGDGGANRLIGGDGPDALTGGGGADHLDGDEGDDDFLGDATKDGADVFHGGEGTDRVSYVARSAAVTADVATDEAPDADDGQALEGDDVGADVEDLAGGGGGDTLIGDADVNDIDGGAGDDTIDGRAGADTLEGGGGTGDRVTYAASAAGVTVDLSVAGAQAGAEDDTLAGFERVSGSPHDDTLRGDDDGNVLDGGAGTDTVEGRNGDDVLTGGGDPGDTVSFESSTNGMQVDLGITGPQNTLLLGTDTISGFADILGGSGPDDLVGDAGPNAIEGGDGQDRIVGRAGDDVLQGGDDDDAFVADAGPDGRDEMIGGAGEVGVNGIGDIADYSARTAAVTVSLGGADDDGDPATNAGAGEDDDVHDDVETLFGGAGGDTLVADDDANHMRGNGGDDTIEPRGGADIVNGDAGAHDRLSYADAPAAIEVTLDAIDGEATGDGADTFGGIEDVTGSAQADTLTGDGAANDIDGGAGVDAITGGLGADALDGGGDADTLDGGAGADDLDGGDGADSVTGGADADSLRGGDGDGDSLFARDALADTVIDCGAGAGDSAETDVADPAVAGCESESRPAPPDTGGGGGGDGSGGGGVGGGGGGGGGGGDLPGAPPVPPVPPAPFVPPIPGDRLPAGAVAILCPAGTTAGVQCGRRPDGTIVIVGTEGPDTIAGTPGPDDIDGRGGNDRIAAGENNAAGRRAAGLPVALAAQAPAVDRVVGGTGNDTLSGDGGNDVVLGGTGNDKLRGGAGNDRLSDTAGRDAFDGGAGDDTIDSRDRSRKDRRARDRVTCAAGRKDRVSADRRDRVAKSCERVKRRR